MNKHRHINTFEVILIVLVVITIALMTNAIFNWFDPLKEWLWGITFGELEQQTNSLIDQLMY